MLQQHKKSTNIFVGLGIVLSILAKVVEKNGFAPGFVAMAISIIAVASMIWGCVHYAKGKGYSPYWGALGLFYILGFLVLFFFPDKHKDNA